MSSSTSTPSSSPRVFIVTGGNRGLGYSSIEKLLQNNKSDDLLIVLASRSAEQGQKAVQSLHHKGYKNVKLLVLDIGSESSIAKAADEVKRDYGYVDVIINNAGILLEDTPDDIVDTIRVNYHGPRLVAHYFKPLLKGRDGKGARVINVSSLMAQFTLAEYNESFQKQVTSGTLSEEQLNNLVSEFVEVGRRGQEALDKLYGARMKRYSYGTSKVFLNALTAVQARDSKNKHDNIFYTAVHPGYVNTDMNINSPEYNADMAITPDEGAKNVLFPLSLSAIDENAGVMYFESKPYPPFMQVPQQYAFLVRRA